MSNTISFNKAVPFGQQAITASARTGATRFSSNVSFGNTGDSVEFSENQATAEAPEEKKKFNPWLGIPGIGAIAAGVAIAALGHFLIVPIFIGAALALGGAVLAHWGGNISAVWSGGDEAEAAGEATTTKPAEKAGGAEGTDEAGGAEGTDEAGGAEGTDEAGGAEGSGSAGEADGADGARGAEGTDEAGGAEGTDEAGGAEGTDEAGGAEGTNEASRWSRWFRRSR